MIVEPAATRLWSGDAPGARGQATGDVPTLTPYLSDPATATGAAMVILPGGGYGILAEHEGRDYAEFLRAHGVAGFVLEYRLSTYGYGHPFPLDDATRAVRLVRDRATEWGVDPKRVGIMGSSAGGHLASTLLTHFDAGRLDASDPVERQSSRPDLGVLCYPVISMCDGLTHEGSRERLLGSNPSAELIHQLSSELQVTPHTPPCFLWHTGEDEAIGPEGVLAFATALREKGVPFDLHIYQKGAHGLGLGDAFPFAQTHPWADALLVWLRIHGFVKGASTPY